MEKFGKWPLLERVTNDEFFKLLAYFNLEQHLLTQVFVHKKKWIHLLDANLQTLELKCGICNEQVRSKDIKNHLIQNDHLMKLRSNVKQFFHPFYTYDKADVKLARGEYAPPEIREKAVRELNIHMKIFKKEYAFTKRFAHISQVIETNLSKKIENPGEMFVMVSLPLEDIPKLIFCVVSGEWNDVLYYGSLKENTKFHCNICRLNCCGIKNLNFHLNGFTHRSKQLGVLALCYESSSRVNKNCCLRFSNSFSFSIKEDAKNFHRNQHGNDSSSWITKLPLNEIAEKIKALNSYALKILSYPDSNENLGLLGVEYVLKILKNEHDRDPRFECGLCEFVGDDKKMQRHLLFYDHKKKYLDLHYFDTIKKYEDSIGHMCYKEFRSVMSEVVNKVAIEIEKHHSRSLPYTVLLSDYKLRRPDLIAEAYALLHASQNRGPSFSNVLSKEDITNLKNSANQLLANKYCENTENIIFTAAPKRKVYLNQTSHDPVVRLSEYKAKMYKNLSSRNSRSVSPPHVQVFDAKSGDTRSDRSRTRAHKHRTHSRSPIYRRSRTPIQKPQSILQLSNALNCNIWDIYRREIALAANEIEVAYEHFRKNPESHPLYEEEWNTFWQHRKKELEREGYNHRSYNFQPEWVHYFKQRIEVLFGEALHKSKITIRHRLEIPVDAEEDCQRSHECANQYAISRRIKEEAEGEDLLQRHKRRSSSGLEHCIPEKQRAFSEQMHGQMKEELSVTGSEAIISKIIDNHSNVVHVLRSITAMEEHLGSLGGKIMDLLSNALQMEKKYAGNNVEFEAKVLTVANCQLVETAMEKLKGILFAGLLDEKKISGFNRVIQYTSNLLRYAEKMGWRQEENVSEKNNFRNTDRARMANEQEHMCVKQNRNDGRFCKVFTEKSLSDTLIDLLHTPDTSQQQIKLSNDQFESYTNQHSSLPDCPPPPNIRETDKSINLLAGFKGQQSNSGLASFNTKLSLDQTNKSQELHAELMQLHRNTISSGSNLYNNSFKNNNDTRTNINTQVINGDAKKKNDGTSQFRNSQFIPNMGQNYAMYQGVGRVNRNWLQLNRMN